MLKLMPSVEHSRRPRPGAPSFSTPPGPPPRPLPKQVGDLTVTGELLYHRSGHRYVRCVCRCGKEEAVRTTTLFRRKKEACESCTRLKAGRSRRDCSQHPLYTLWEQLKTRNQLSSAFADFYAFASWARRHGYHKRRVLSRRDNTRPYDPENAYFR